jgi:hypothetical protein
MRKHARSLIRVLSEQIESKNVRYGAEIGVWKGELSSDLLDSFPDLFLVMVDLWSEFSDSSMHNKDNTNEAMLSAMQEAERSTEFARGRRRLIQGPSVKIAADWYDSDFIFGFVFVDADHFYDSVKADLEAWWPKVRVGGVMAGHDYNGQGDRRKGWGVKRAVDEFFGKLGLTVNIEPGLVWWTKKE